jgi:hypothetical protein
MHDVPSAHSKMNNLYFYYMLLAIGERNIAVFRPYSLASGVVGRLILKKSIHPSAIQQPTTGAPSDKDHGDVTNPH